MARIPDVEIERLKAEVSLERLVESSGVKLERRGADLVGLCPFHDEATPSLSVTPAKNLFHCFGCGAAGGPIDWVMRREGVSFRHAVELLRDGAPVAASGPVKETTVRRLAAPVKFDADDQALLNQVVGYYHERLKQSPEALAYLKARGLDHPELIDRFKLGYADRTLGLRLPEKTRKAGADMRGRLERIGLYRESGHEHFTGSLVVPVLDERGGREGGVRPQDRLGTPGPGTPMHLYLPGPHAGGVEREWDRRQRRHGEVILCEALIDAMTFWCAGYRNVTASFGVNGFTADHLAAFQRYGVERVLIAYDRDEAGEKAASELAEKLIAEGLACYRIEFPKAMDANAYALKLTPATKSLGVLIRKAAWLGQGRAPALHERAPRMGWRPCQAKPALLADLAPDEAPASLLAAKEEIPDLPEPIASPAPPASSRMRRSWPQTDQGELVLMQGDRRYRVRGWRRSPTPESMKVNLLVSRGESHGDGRFHVDTLDLYGAKARATFVKQAGIELGEAEDTLKHDLGRVLLKLEAVQDAELTAALTKDARPAMSEADRAEALDLLTDPDLIGRILKDFAASGIVGEETNTLTGYLACVSRLLDRPLAVIIQSSSAAGKSSLMDAVLALMPAEAQVRYSAMTGQSLFYMGEVGLKHRILAIAEEEGCRERQLRPEAPPIRGRGDNRLDRQGPGDGAARHPRVPGGGAGDAVPDHHGHRHRRGAAEPLPRPHRERDPRADPRDPRPPAPAPDPGGPAGSRGPRGDLAPAPQRPGDAGGPGRGEPVRGRADLPGRQDAHPARPHEVPDLDPLDRAAAPAPAAHPHGPSSRAGGALHRGGGRRHRAGQPARPRGAGAHPGRAAAADPALARGAARMGGRGVRAPGHQALRPALRPSPGARVDRLGRHPGQGPPGTPGRAGIPARPSGEGRPGLRVRASV